MKIEAWNPPFLHHSPRTHAGSTRCTVDGEQIDLGLGSPLDGHSQFPEAVCPGFQGNSLETQATKPSHFRQKSILADKAKTAVPFEFLEGSVPICRLNHGAGWIGRDDIASLLEIEGTIQAVDFDFSPDALGTLSPLELDGLKSVLADNIFRNSQPGILDVHLH